MIFLDRLARQIDRALSFILLLLMILLVLDVCWQVFTRFLLEKPDSFTEEAARFILIWLSLLGAASAYFRGMHLGIDVFVNKLAEEKRLLVQHLTHFLVLLFAALILVFGGIKLVLLTLDLQQTSAALNVKMGYIYLALPLSGVLFSVFAINFIVNPQTRVEEPDITAAEQ